MHALTYVLDASAVLAVLNREPGADDIAVHFPGSAISAVNYAEVAQKRLERGMDPLSLRTRLLRSQIRIESFELEDAELTAELWPATRPFGLSLGDRACLALAIRLDLPALTCERAWAQLKTKADVRVVR
ncbi:MAG: type II toxin-antitoxin system VapC family toxin [Chloroflexi bacterium]|nr:type II toxin-antitoxin system VapC family toxin [Chloroflexota bacterium]